MGRAVRYGRIAAWGFVELQYPAEARPPHVQGARRCGRQVGAAVWPRSAVCCRPGSISGAAALDAASGLERKMLSADPLRFEGPHALTHSQVSEVSFANYSKCVLTIIRGVV